MKIIRNMKGLALLAMLVSVFSIVQLIVVPPKHISVADVLFTLGCGVYAATWFGSFFFNLRVARRFTAVSLYVPVVIGLLAFGSIWKDYNDGIFFVLWAYLCNLGAVALYYYVVIRWWKKQQWPGN